VHTRIAWQRLDEPGMEWCGVTETDAGLDVEGVALVVLDGVAHRAEYTISVDPDGRTRRVRVSSAADDRAVELESDGLGRWQDGAGELIVDAVDEPAALDVDLGFTPFTNSLPIRRLAPRLAVGGTAPIRVAWVLFPGLEIVEGRQWYDRLGEHRWRYRSDGFAAELVVDDNGIVTEYAGLWRAIARS
jgi:uncharacterized protein